MDIGAFFTPSNLFDITPGPWQGYGSVVLYVAIAILLIGIVLKLLATFGKYEARIKMLLTKLSSVVIFTGIFSGFFWFSRTQLIPLFGARFWWVLLGIVVVIWVVFIVKSMQRTKVNQEKYKERAEVYDKYLPKRKK